MGTLPFDGPRERSSPVGVTEHAEQVWMLRQDDAVPESYLREVLQAD